MKRLLLGAVLVGIAHSAAAQGHWYYCDPARAYYPYLKACPVPWREVTPDPYGQDQQHESSPPTVQPAAPAWVDPVPTVAPPRESQPSATYRQGQADRQRWETWFGTLTGDYRSGAEYWAGNRSVLNPVSCNAAPSSTGADWTAGCIAAQQRLTDSDVRRKTEPDYRRGWNNPTQPASPTTSAAGARNTQVLAQTPAAAQTPALTPKTAPTIPDSQPSTFQSDGHDIRQSSPTASLPAVSDAPKSVSASPTPIAPQSSDGDWIIGVVIALIGAIWWAMKKAFHARRGGGGLPGKLPHAPVASAGAPYQQTDGSSRSDQPDSASDHPLLQVKRTSVPSAVPFCRLVTSVGPRGGARQFYSTPPRRRRDAQWIPPGGSVAVNGFDIPGGMVYVGNFMPASPGGGWGADEPAPCLINPALKVGAGKPRTDLDMGYWPSYSDIDPIHRLNYLHWLSSGKRETSFPVGYAFLYFYGLEHRLLADNPSPQEETLLITEVERLRNLYAASGSFTGYSTALLDLVQLRRLSAVPPGLIGWRPSLAEQGETMSIHLRLKLGVMAARGTPLDFEHAMAAMLTMPKHQGGIRRGIGMTRTRAEFLDLARRRFATQFPAGFALRDRKDSTLALTYRAASRNLEVGIRVEGIARVPDPLNLAWAKMSEFCAKTADDLTPYAKAVGKERVRAKSVEAALALPGDYGDAAATTAFKQWLGTLPAPFAEVPLTTLGHWCFGDRKTAAGSIKQVQQISAILTRVGYGMEPDPTYGSPRPHDTVLVFLAEASAGTGAAFQHAGLIAAVLASGEATADRGARIVSELASRLALNPSETGRVAARHRMMRGRALPVSGLTKLGQSMTAEERSAIAAMSAAVAAACGEAGRDTITALERLHDAFGVERRALYAALHQGAANNAAPSTEPVVVELPPMPSIRFRIPPPPAQVPSTKVAIDMARVGAILRQTREVAQVLAPIYEDDAPSPAQPAAEVPLAPPGSRFPGLGADHVRLLEALCCEDRWSRADYQAKARDFGLLPDGAVEAINEWAYDELGDELIEDGDPLIINVALLPDAPEKTA